ncbi:thioredoxin C-1 [Drosophila willistoni]|nr:thioredoxin C-1 [Drosophila willistoni]
MATIGKVGNISRCLAKVLMRRSFATLRPSRAIFDVETTKDFEKKVVQSDKPVVVDFHASWCTPCKALAPRLENIVSEQQGQVRLARVDVDEHCELALNYNVGSVPSLLVMHNGKVINRMVGLQTTEYIRDWLKKVMTSASDSSEK